MTVKHHARVRPRIADELYALGFECGPDAFVCLGSLPAQFVSSFEALDSPKRDACRFCKLSRRPTQ